MIDRSDPLWFKDAVIYQLHIKAFFDANNDGIGDFAGLIEKLDYVKSLGVTAIWVLPFYPSPLRDDGYDISDYRDVNASYGRLGDFRRFVKAAHDRGLRVITELVVNHTSDQHRWFQRARHAKPGSKWRDYYVWSDTDEKYEGTRIIFLDTETSNWTWDPVAKAYYWHRFYSHQPDLNYDNPRVLQEIMAVLRFWLDMGVDGMRLDAVPYLVEREGTNNENLPETHAILKKIRAEMDAHYPDRMLLAEANQWPEDTQEYFGDGDECHMAFHFPLMPRMYMAIAQEDRHPITDIMRQTPDIPDQCQWAIFLRNHDELTLEMVSDRERDYLWNFYAADRRMRINLGIRRRLAPLLGNDRRKIELMNSLLLSMPGTPILYYGDEIGMGDNIYLGDRDGVRTPMQWSPDRNGGFSRADPARLYLPAIMDPIYGFEAVNVEAQQRSASSLLNWMQRMINVRQLHKSFGRGTLNFLYPGNRKVLAYLREHDGETILCVVNLSRSAEAVELDLSRYRGRVPVELLGRSRFPPIGDLPYLLTLASYGFYWFILEEEALVPRWHEELPEPLPEFVTLVVRRSISDIVSGRERQVLESDVLPYFMPKQRWFAAKDTTIAATRIVHAATLNSSHGEYVLIEVEVELHDGQRQRYLMPLAVEWDESAVATTSPLLPLTIAKARRVRSIGPVYDAMADESFPLAVAEAMRAGTVLEGPSAEIRFTGTDALHSVELPADITTRRLGVEQSNSSAVIGDVAVFKVYRRLVSGTHPEIEISRFLTTVAGFRNTPPFFGAVERVEADGTTTALAILQGFVLNQGDGWAYTLNYLDRWFDEQRLHADAEQEERDHGMYMAQVATLGRRTGEMHRALAIDTDDPDFRPEPISKSDMQRWQSRIRRQARSAFEVVEHRLDALPDNTRPLAESFLSRREEIDNHIRSLTETPIAAAKTRLHGDYHLGQVLVVKDDFYILDFEGEPARPLEERREKTSPLKDVAGMLRSFDYAAWASVARLAEHAPETTEAAGPWAEAWRREAAETFLAGYEETAAGGPGWPEDRDEVKRAIELFVIEKACYEICYEAANRPSWLGIPIRGVLAVLDRLEETGDGDNDGR